MLECSSESEVLENIQKYITLSEVETIADDNGVGDVLERKTRCADGSEIDAVKSWLCDHSVNGNRLGIALLDYAPDISLGSMSNPSKFIYDIMSGNALYERRTTDDRNALDTREMVVEAMLDLCRVEKEIESDGGNNEVPLRWYLSRQFLYANTKNPPYLAGVERYSVDAGRRSLAQSRSFAANGALSPRDRIRLWLDMTPRDQFTTEEGRREWDALKDQMLAGSCADNIRKKDALQPATDDEVKAVLEGWIADIRSLGELSSEYNSNRVRCVSTGKIVNRRKLDAIFSRIDKKQLWILKHVQQSRGVNKTISDYYNDLRIGKSEGIIDRLMSIVRGESEYTQRNASDAIVLSGREEIVDSMFALHSIMLARNSGQESLSRSVDEMRFKSVLSGYAKTDISEGQPRSITFGWHRLISADEGKEPMPSRLELWLAMYPRNLFTTDEGRAERDRLQDQFIHEQKTRWREMIKDDVIISKSAPDERE